MSEILIIITALLFLTIGFFLGRYSGREIDIARKTLKDIKRKINPPHSGVINYATPRDIEYEGSEEQKVDAERERVFRENFKI